MEKKQHSYNENKAIKIRPDSISAKELHDKRQNYFNGPLTCSPGQVSDQQKVAALPACLNSPVHYNQTQSLTLVLNSVEAPCSKRNFTTSLWPCCAAKNRAVAPV